MRQPVTAIFAACLIFVQLGATAASSGVWLNVPFVKQEKNGCGAACIAMVIDYWRGHDGALAASDAGEVRRTLYSAEAEGIWAADMERYLKDAGFRTFVFKGAWADLRQHLAKGRPLMVSLRENGRGAAFHCVVVGGIDWQREIVLVNDPARRKLLEVHRADFERAWNGSGNWTILAVPRPSTEPRP